MVRWYLGESVMVSWPLPNASANLRASRTKRERSELPWIARQVQRSLGAVSVAV